MKALNREWLTRFISVTLAILQLTLSHDQSGNYNRLEFLQQMRHSSDKLNHQRGITFCASDTMVPDVLRNIYQIRHLWNSSLPFLVAHCSEITSENQGRLLSSDHYLSIVDVCKVDQQGQIFGMDADYGRKRLRSFFCKIAALIVSTFDETMIIDLDVVWFKKPDVVFNYIGYKETGALFFRDRVVDFKPGASKPAVELKYFFNKRNVTISKSISDSLIQNGINTHNLYWRHVSGTAQYLRHYQDSSVLVVRKSKHSKLLETLRKVIDINYLGYGDKELFWIAATISGEPYVFEPFLAAQYGDCQGLIMHYDPNEAIGYTGNNSMEFIEAAMLYMNAEYMLEREPLEAVGMLLRNEITSPVLINATTPLYDYKTFSQRSRAISNCTCTDLIHCAYGLTPQSHINKCITRMQWLVKTLEKTPTFDYSLDCINVEYGSSELVQEIVREFVAKQHCFFTGCSSLASSISVNSDLDNGWHLDDQYCDPISYDMNYTLESEPGKLTQLARMSHTPNTSLNFMSMVEETLYIYIGGLDITVKSRDKNRSVYYYHNGTLHHFKNKKMFVTKDFHIKDTKYFTNLRLLYRIPRKILEHIL